MKVMDNVRSKIKNCPFQATFDSDTCEIIFPSEIIYKNSASKSIDKMRNLLKYPDYNGEEIFYTFYEGVIKKEDFSIFQENMIRYDLIVVHPGTILDEYKKTSGHYHCKVAGQDISYPEIYEVMQGNALFILQRCNINGDILEVFAVRGNPGDKLLIPPEFGHATINIGNEPLIFADLVSSKSSNIYGLIGENHGMSYYVLADNNQNFRFVNNLEYNNVPEIKLTDISENSDLGIWKDRPIYSEFINNPSLFEYLNTPNNYLDKFIKF